MCVCVVCCVEVCGVCVCCVLCGGVCCVEVCAVWRCVLCGGVCGVVCAFSFHFTTTHLYVLVLSGLSHFTSVC